MNEIRLLLRAAAGRMELSAFLVAMHCAGVVLTAIALVLALADRAPAEPFVAWVWVAPILCFLCLVSAIVLWSRKRLTELHVAIAVDDRLQLREKLSTALHCHNHDDAFARAAVEDAVATARDPRVRETLSRKFAVTAPRRWWVSPVIVILAAAVLQLPQADLFAGEDPIDQEEVEHARRQAAESLQIVARAIEDKPDLSAAIADLVDELKTENEGPELLKRPEQVKRDALKKVTELNKRLDEIISGEKGKTARALDEMLSKLDTPESGLARELAEALARGDFQKAREAMEKLKEAAENGRMSDEQKQQLAQQLQNLADQLQQLAQQQQALQQALQQAGLDPQLANNPQALQQALQQAQNLNAQQKQQLQQMAQAQQQACQMCQGLGQAMQQMAQAMQNGQMGPAGQQMGNQLSQMEQLQQLLQQAQAAANQCQGQCQGLGQGLNMQQALQQWLQGGGMGNWGQGAGGKAPIAPTPTGSKMTKADAPIVPGEIIAQTLIDGVPIKGEAKAKLKQVIDAGAEGYDEAQAEDRLPREYHEALKHYFGELAKQVEATKVATSNEGDDEAGDIEDDSDDESEPAEAEGESEQPAEDDTD